MGINVKAKQTKIQVGEQKGTYRFVLQADTYNTLSVKKVLNAAAKNSGLHRGTLQTAWDAIGEAVRDWATEGHSVAIPGLGHMRFGIRATSVEDVAEVSSKLITSRRVIFNPSVEIKQELAGTSISITCYDKDGQPIKTVTSTDKDDIEEDDGGTETPSPTPSEPDNDPDTGGGDDSGDDDDDGGLAG